MIAALWWGSLTTVAFLVVPLLFAHLPTPAMAGQTAAKLFTAQSWVSLGCSLFLMLLAREKHAPALAKWAHPAIFLIAAGVLLAMLVEYAVAPRIATKVDLRFWHSLGSAMLVAQWLCTTGLVWQILRAATPPAGKATDPTGAS